MTVKTLRSALAIVGLGLAFATSANAAFSPITLVSGNGTVGTVDTAVTYALGPQTGPFGGSLPFGSATTPAYVVPPNGNWTATIGGAQWDSISPTGYGYNGSTALYAISYTITTAPTSTLFLTGLVAADDTIGGIYIDGNTVTGPIGPSTMGFVAPATNVGIIALGAYAGTVGTHTLYVYDINLNPGSPSGVLFNLTLSTVPEPSSIILVGLAGLVGVGLKVRRKRSIA